MDPLTVQIDTLTAGQREAYRIMLTVECAELGIKFRDEDENDFGFISDEYPDTPFLSLASLVMLERIQCWLEFSFEDANRLTISLYGTDDLSFIEGRQAFFTRIARALIGVIPTAQD